MKKIADKTNTKREKYLASVLAECNKIRVAHGWEPVKALKPGYPLQAGSCPVARTIGHGAWMGCATGVGFDLGRRSVAATPNRLLQDFANQFDSEHFPELILHKKIRLPAG